MELVGVRKSNGTKFTFSSMNFDTLLSRVYLELATIFIPNILAFSDMMLPCPLINSYRRFREACSIHLKGISSHALLVGWLDPICAGSKLRRNFGKYLYQYLTLKKMVL